MLCDATRQASRLPSRAGGPGPVRWSHGTRPRHRRRRGVPRDAVLAVRGGAADDRRQPRARHAAVGADRARDARAARARRLHRPQRRADDRVHRRRPRARRATRQPPPDDRAVPDRRRRRAVGRRPRGGREARARDDAAVRGVRARLRRRRQDLPARPPDPGRRADRRRAAGRLLGRGQGDDPAPRERGRGSAPLPQGRGDRAGARGRGRDERRRERVRERRTVRPRRSPRASPRPCRCSPIPRRRRGSRCPSNSCSAASATGAKRRERRAGYAVSARWL